MIAIDTNVLVYAYREDSEFHNAALQSLRPVIEGAAPWALPWPCLHEFVGIVTHAKIYKPASSLAKAFGFLESLMGAPQLQLLSESTGYFERLRSIAREANITGSRIHDARIAALCLHHGVSELWTDDRDFSAFPQIKIHNPLAQKAKLRE